MWFGPETPADPDAPEASGPPLGVVPTPERFLRLLVAVALFAVLVAVEDGWRWLGILSVPLGATAIYGVCPVRWLVDRRETISR